MLAVSSLPAESSLFFYHKGSTRISEPFFKEPLRLSTPSFWVAPDTQAKSRVLVLKEARNLPEVVNWKNVQICAFSAIHCPSIRLGPFLLQIEAGIMSYTRMCLDSCGSLCEQIGRASSSQWLPKPCSGGFAWENSMCWPTSPTTWSFHSIFLQ